MKFSAQSTSCCFSVSRFCRISSSVNPFSLLNMCETLMILSLLTFRHLWTSESMAGLTAGMGVLNFLSKTYRTLPTSGSKFNVVSTLPNALKVQLPAKCRWTSFSSSGLDRSFLNWLKKSRMGWTLQSPFCKKSLKESPAFCPLMKYSLEFTSMTTTFSEGVMNASSSPHPARKSKSAINASRFIVAVCCSPGRPWAARA